MGMRLLGMLLLVLSGSAHAAMLVAGSYTVTVEGPAEAVDIGTLELKAGDGGFSFSFALDETRFSDQFLSMRPFKCLDGDVMVCHLAYPYERKMWVSTEDLVDLEYEFLFIVRTPKEYGIDPYNGRYFVFSVEGEEMIGRVHAVDLNLLASPPETGNLRPLEQELLDEIEAEFERFARIRIHR